MLQFQATLTDPVLPAVPNAPPPINAILGEMWIQFSGDMGWPLHGHAWYQQNFGFWWSSKTADWPWFDASDVADILNSLGYQRELDM